MNGANAQLAVAKHRGPGVMTRRRMPILALPFRDLAFDADQSLWGMTPAWSASPR
jgi:hypothetical protein